MSAAANPIIRLVAFVALDSPTRLGEISRRGSKHLADRAGDAKKPGSALTSQLKRESSLRPEFRWLLEICATFQGDILRRHF
ncbi:MAG: hypothetical protein ACM3JD_14400 [Rudaea sp.]